jgi:predicted molibdopterin-dependent oxidoreductase YjgC
MTDEMQDLKDRIQPKIWRVFDLTRKRCVNCRRTIAACQNCLVKETLDAITAALKELPKDENTGEQQ